MNKSIKILLIEDDYDDVDLLKEALDENNVLYTMDVIGDGGLVSSYIEKCTSYPDIVVLDFNLPRVHGREILKQLKNTSAFKHIPVLILTTSSSQTDINYAYQHGADKYLIKPTTIKGINLIVTAIINSHKN